MKFLLPNYSCLQNPWLGGYRPQIPVLYVLCPQLNLLNPPNKIPVYATDPVEMFSAYTQEVNLKFHNSQFILLMVLFRAWHTHRKFQREDLWSYAFAWQCQKHRLTSHTHHIFLKISLTTFSSHQLQFTRDILAASPSRTETDQTLLSCASFYRLTPSFPIYFTTRRNRVYIFS